MNTATAAVTEATTGRSLAETRERFEAWRDTKTRPNSPIPDELWESAVSLSDAHTITEIAKTLRLDLKALADKVRFHRDKTAIAVPGFHGMPVPGKSSGVPAFVEVALRPSTPRPHTAGVTAVDPRHDPRVIIEMRLPDGTSLKVSQREPLDTEGFLLNLLDGRR